MNLALAALLVVQTHVAPLWTDSSGYDPGREFGTGAAMDSHGNLLTCGERQEVVPGVGTLLHAFMRKLTPAGQLVFDTTIPAYTTGQELRAEAVAFQSDGAIVVAGQDRDYNHFFVRGLSPEGQEQWAFGLDVSSSTTITAEEIAVDAAGLVYVTTIVYTESNSDRRTRLYCLASDGEFQWSRTIIAPRHAFLHRLTVDPSGIAYCYGSWDENGFSSRAAIRAYESNGSMRWQSLTGDGALSSDNRIVDLELDQQGNVIYVATFGLEASSVGNSYLTVEKLDAEEGLRLWAHNWLGADNIRAFGSSLAVDPTGAAVVCGLSWSGTVKPDTFVRRLDALGAVTDTVMYLGPDAGPVTLWEAQATSTTEVLLAGNSEYTNYHPGSEPRAVTALYSPEDGLRWIEFAEPIDESDNSYVYGVFPGPDGDVLAAVNDFDNETADLEAVRYGAGPLYYGSTQENSSGCWPGLQSSGVASVSEASGFVLQAYSLRPDKPAVFLYSLDGAQELPFGGGQLFVAGAFVTTPVQNTGGAEGSPCSGVVELDFNTWITDGNDPAISAGSQVWVQCWSRDPGDASGFNLSGALTFVVQS